MDAAANLHHVSDAIKRWMTPEGTFRILVADSTEAVREAARLANTSVEVTELYGRLLTGGALLQLAQAPADRLQCQLDHAGTAGRMLVDVWPGPTVRGRVENPRPEGGPVFADEGGLVLVSRQPFRGGELYQSVAPLQGGSVAGALQTYVLESEQVLTLFGLVVVFDRDSGELQRAGGMLVQALPGATHEQLAAVTQCLEQARFEDLVRAGDSPFGAAESILHPLRLHHVGDDPLVYRCRCSQDAAVGAVGLLSAEELASIRETGEVERVVCEFCQRTYEVSAADLEANR